MPGAAYGTHAREEITITDEQIDERPIIQSWSAERRREKRGCGDPFHDIK
jgi:hypothetical protein